MSDRLKPAATQPAGTQAGATEAVAAQPEPSFAAHAATFHEAPITPELNALEIVLLDGIKDKKVKEIALEVSYPRMSEDTIKRIREIVEENQGEIPLSIDLVELPASLAADGQVRLKISQHFRVQPGPALNDALQKVHATPRYVF